MEAVRVEPDGRVWLTDVADPEPLADEVVVRVRRAGLCATDRKLVARGTEVPRTPGHEIAGVLDDGTEVVVHPDVGCGTCRWCAEGLENRCADRWPVGLARDGGLARFVAVPRRHVVDVTGLASEMAAALEPLACCVHAVEQLGVSADEPVQVVGAGAMGVLAMWTLQAAGARVVVSQRGEGRRHAALELGADAVCGPTDDPAAALGDPPRAVVVSAPDEAAVTAALEQVEVGGRVHAFAGIPDGGWVDVNRIHYRHLTVVGSTGSGTRDLARAAALVREGRVPLDRLPVEWVALSEVPEALRRPPVAPAVKTMVRIEDVP